MSGRTEVTAAARTAEGSEGKFDGDVERLAARRRADKLVFTRWALVVFNFERELYADPDR